ncbi:WD40/YVTN/BNR-like repeat-containing protein [Nitrosopumilus adriaticus]|uniref:BNR repeat-containing glycosyl hydrolase n=1 Tax=Nitrosopumilus adriaticus TaxID=1580092 RepID=A0A0D5C0H0_9ARCH|nr:YCF48-related protein [Nitrosopumilus adriaticus]AJW69897.1 BNR repeat-containing glycosyl hydrolase [Nitrosopumilus adriaticus]
MESKKKIFVASAIIVVIVVVAISLVDSSLISESTENTDYSKTNDSRIIDWRHVHGVGLDPEDSSILYIATHGDFYQSISGSPPVKVDKVRADYMAFNAPPIPGIPLYASGHPSTGGNTGLIKSNDGGITWEHVSNVIEPPVDFHAMAISKQNPEMIIGFDSGARGLFKTTDAGKTWDTLEYPEYISALAISPNNSELIFAGTGKGIFKSENGGNTWIHLDAYRDLAVFALAFDDDGKLFASVKTFGLVQSDDLGDSWESFQHVDLTVTSIAADSQHKEIYVGGYSSGGFQEVYKIKYDSSTYDKIGTNKGLR